MRRTHTMWIVEYESLFYLLHVCDVWSVQLFERKTAKKKEWTHHVGPSHADKEQDQYHVKAAEEQNEKRVCVCLCDGLCNANRNLCKQTCAHTHTFARTQPWSKNSFGLSYNLQVDHIHKNHFSSLFTFSLSFAAVCNDEHLSPNRFNLRSTNECFVCGF